MHLGKYQTWTLALLFEDHGYEQIEFLLICRVSMDECHSEKHSNKQQSYSHALKWSGNPKAQSIGGTLQPS